jgi:CheY-like chemotaxis protein
MNETQVLRLIRKSDLHHMEAQKNKLGKADGHSVQSPPVVSIKTILLVDDSRGARLMTKWFLDYVGFVVHACSNPEDALARFDPKIHDLVLTDNSMVPMTGAEMAHIIKMRSPNTPVLMYTGAPPADRSCLDAVIQKPTPLPALKAEIDKLLTARS